MSQILNCWIVDDEPLALNLLESYVENTPFLKLTGKYSSAKSAMQALTDVQPHLVFLDIQMPHISGMELACFIDDKTKIIFTTAFKEYALEGYRVNAIDYLLKPISYSNFLEAAKKALTWHEAFEAKNSVSQVQEHRTDGIFVKSEYKMVHLLFNDILYVEGLKSYVKIYTQKSTKSVITLMAMKEIEELLPKDSFLRVHRSYIVAKNKIESVERNRIFIGTKKIPIGETYKDAFFRAIGQAY
ncbi:MAG: DNA-binding response regulator [Bacteroidales bacterium 36-12]|nr:MAG: DNA-binding response regulator [Bacteroidales bacterium 36-12]